MNILVIGNGFDLAHGLPTKYSDFLDFIILCLQKWHNWKKYVEWPKENSPYKNDANVLCNILDNYGTNKKVCQIFENNKEQIEKKLAGKNELSYYYQNTWIRYCMYVYSHKRIFPDEFKWIDIETEILKLIIQINAYNFNHFDLSNSSLSIDLPFGDYDNIGIIQFQVNGLNQLAKKEKIPEEFVKRKIFEFLFSELEKFAEVLKFYLSLAIGEYSKSNAPIFNINTDNPNGISINRVISFNYTNTYELFYSKSEKSHLQIHYINGDLKNQNSKIILGIENPSLKETNNYCDNNINLFFKNIQRVLYNYSYLYDEWLNYNNYNFMEENINTNDLNAGLTVHIIGHSLAISDKYILLNVIKKANRVYIYFYNEKDKQDKITNLYRLLGDEFFSNHVNHSIAKPTIKFVNQKDIIIQN